MVCQKCGAENTESSLYCSKCGTQLDEGVDSPPDAETPQPSPTKPRGAKRSRGGSITLIVIAVLAFVCIKGCTQKDDSPAADKPSAPTAAQQASSSPSAGQSYPSQPSDNASESRQPAKTMAGIGDTQQTKVWNITLNNAYVTRAINEQNNEFLIARSYAGEVFLVVDVTFENRTKQTQSFSSLLESPKVVTEDGYEYTYDFEGAMALGNSFEDGDVTPGLKKRGQWAFKIRDDSTDLYFAIEFFSKTYTWFLCNTLPDV